MKGKNKKRGTYAIFSDPPLDSHDTRQIKQSRVRSISKPESSRARFPGATPYLDNGEDPESSETALAADAGFVTPRPPPIDFSLVKFAGEVDNYSREYIKVHYLSSQG